MILCEYKWIAICNILVKLTSTQHAQCTVVIPAVIRPNLQPPAHVYVRKLYLCIRSAASHTDLSSGKDVSALKHLQILLALPS